MLLILLIAIALPVSAAEDIEGSWMLSLQDKQRTLVGMLEIEKSDEGWIGYLEGGPVGVEINGDNIVITADSRDVRGFVFDRRMEGVVDGDSISGTYSQVGAADQKEAPGPWHAERQTADDGVKMAAKPFDLTGTWTATQELDFRKYTMALTPAGQEWLDGYLPYYDQPDVRCTSIGLPALATYSFPFEVIASENRLTMIYEYQGKVRRIWLDGRAPGEFVPASRMGHSNASWDGSTLVVNTTHLEKTVRDFRGELISENARIEERYSLSDDGNTLTAVAVITVFDPDNYSRPPVRRRQWQRNDSADIFPYTCDPDSFYLQMYEDGDLDMYLERTDKRF
jgi:hypothetical protein